MQVETIGMSERTMLLFREVDQQGELKKNNLGMPILLSPGSLAASLVSSRSVH
jgi:hypothetical protein